MIRKKTKQEPLYSWEIKVSSITNPLVWIQSILAVGSGVAFVFLLLVGLNLYERRWNEIPASIAVAVYLFLGMFFLFAMVMIIMNFRGSRVRYELNRDGITQYSLEQNLYLSSWFKWLGLIGLLSGKSAGYTASGATLLSKSKNIIYSNWEEINRVKTYPLRGEIQLLNDWRVVMQVFVPKNQYDEISKWIKVHIKPIKEQKRETPFAYKLILSFFTVLFGSFLIPQLPIQVKPILTITVIFSLLFAIWTDGSKKVIASIFTLIITISTLILSIILYGVDLQRDGAEYALIIEMLIYCYFISIAYYTLRKSQL